MADTPLEQDVLAEATKCTGEETVELLAGEETFTPARLLVATVIAIGV